MGGTANPATADTPQVLLEHHLKMLRLPTFLREYDKVARQCSDESVDYPRYLLRMTELELLDRERRATERRIQQARFPVVKSLDTFEFLSIPSVNKALVLELAGANFFCGARTCCCWVIPARLRVGDKVPDLSQWLRQRRSDIPGMARAEAESRCAWYATMAKLHR